MDYLYIGILFKTSFDFYSCLLQLLKSLTFFDVYKAFQSSECFTEEHT